MAIEPELVELMPHTITVQDYSSVNEYGEPTFGTGYTVTAMVEERPEVIRDAFGEEIITSHIVYAASTARIDLTSQVTLPDGTQPPIRRSDVFYDETGDIHHVALFFGSAAG
jgi:hypothetical protein